MKKTIKLIFLLTTILLVVSTTVQAGSYTWYCKRTKDHTQPPLPSEFSFITDHGGIYIDKTNSDSEASIKKVYLTFDAGYSNKNVEKILDVLSENEVSGAFFILSNLINTSPEIVTRMSNEGHLVCNHTSKHKDMSSVTNIDDFKRELLALEELYRSKTGKEMAKYFRPPEGRFNQQTLEFANELGYKTVFWSFAYADWDNGKQMSHADAKKKILDNIHNGAVLLLHPTSETNAEILDDIIKVLKSDGYTFGTLDELAENNKQA